MSVSSLKYEAAGSGVGVVKEVLENEERRLGVKSLLCLVGKSCAREVLSDHLALWSVHSRSMATNLKSVQSVSSDDFLWNCSSSQIQVQLDLLIHVQGSFREDVVEMPRA